MECVEKGITVYGGRGCFLPNYITRRVLRPLTSSLTVSFFYYLTYLFSDIALPLTLSRVVHSSISSIGNRSGFSMLTDFKEAEEAPNIPASPDPGEAPVPDAVARPERSYTPSAQNEPRDGGKEDTMRMNNSCSKKGAALITVHHSSPSTFRIFLTVMTISPFF